MNKVALVTGASSGIGAMTAKELVNNAGYGSYGSYGAIEDVLMEEARRQFDVNFFGMARLIQLVTPSMRER